MHLRPYAVTVPEGTSGNWKVERFSVSSDQSKMSFVNGHGRGVRQGSYTSLSYKGGVVMSDTPDEYFDHRSAISRAQGHCLVNGLGLGLVLQEMAKKPEVTKVTVIEISPDVIKLVGDHYMTMFPSKIEIIQADAFEYQPPKGVRYGCVWHDVWENMCEDNLPEMHKLHRKYGRRTDWQGSWGRALIELRKEQTKDAFWRK